MEGYPVIVTETQSSSRICSFILSFIVLVAVFWLIAGMFRPRDGGCRAVYGDVKSCADSTPPLYDGDAGPPPLEAYYPPEPGTPLGKLSATPNVAFPDAREAGAPYNATSFSNSEEAESYYRTFNPMSLQRAMPSNWRTQKEGCPGKADKTYDEFSRYTISPQKTKASTALAGVMRLGTNTRQGLSRTLGPRSLLHDAVVQLSPVPIGDSAFTFLDSSVRQSYIAAAMGAFPETKNS